MESPVIEETIQTNIDIGAFDPQKLKNYMNRENDGDNQNNEDVNEEEKKILKEKIMKDLKKKRRINLKKRRI